MNSRPIKAKAALNWPDSLTNPTTPNPSDDVPCQTPPADASCAGGLGGSGDPGMSGIPTLARTFVNSLPPVSNAAVGPAVPGDVRTTLVKQQADCCKTFPQLLLPEGAAGHDAQKRHTNVPLNSSTGRARSPTGSVVAGGAALRANGKSNHRIRSSLVSGALGAIRAIVGTGFLTARVVCPLSSVGGD